MLENIVVLSGVDKQKNAEAIVSAALAQQVKIIEKNGGASRFAYCDSVNNMLPVILNGAGVYVCIFSADVVSLPEEPFYLTKGNNRVLAYRMKQGETFEDVLALYNRLGEICPDFDCISTDSMPECDFEEIENTTDIYVSCDNVKFSAIKNCEDGSGDLVFRVFETGEKTDTRLFITSDGYDFGFWLDIREGEVKTFRVGKDSIVRETNLLEGIAPFDEMLE
ncbi:MAG: hypothetical protein IJZ35_08505 [Clostridia bacterium]|nr:hypothetical protein [Clostridia bacterium]